jgi:type II secretory pathway predicted ATPase ExeA
MYKKFFGLKENPFNVNPDPRYLFLTGHTQEALACLTYGIETRKGFILLTGDHADQQVARMAAQGARLHRLCVQPAPERLAIFRFHDGRLRHPL